MRSARRAVLAALTAAATAAALAGLAPASSASVTGPAVSYLVLAPEGAGTALAAARVAAAGGTIVATYDQIDVLVARLA